MVNYELKKKLLDNGAVQAYRSMKRSEWFEMLNGEIVDISIKDKVLIDSLDNTELTECQRIYKAHLERVLRLKKRVKSILSFTHSVFITLTFTNDVLATTSAPTRRRYVTRYLNKFGGDYVANIDFGSQTDREHYHAVVGFDILLDTPLWNYGFKNIQHIRIQDKTDTKIAKYIAKLTNHAIKETSKGSRMIYAKNY